MPGGPIHEFLRIKDGAGIVVTSIDPHDYSYSYDGNFILGYSHAAMTYRASDNTGHCGTGYYGWTLEPSSYLQVNEGGIGQMYASSRAHAEFSYAGIFDCSGTTYYNILDTKLTGYGDGSPSTCAYRFWARNLAFGWYMERLCWDANVYTTPPAF